MREGIERRTCGQTRRHRHRQVRITDRDRRNHIVTRDAERSRVRCWVYTGIRRGLTARPGRGRYNDERRGGGLDLVGMADVIGGRSLMACQYRHHFGGVDDGASTDRDYRVTISFAQKRSGLIYAIEGGIFRNVREYRRLHPEGLGNVAECTACHQTTVRHQKRIFCVQRGQLIAKVPRGAGAENQFRQSEYEVHGAGAFTARLSLWPIAGRA